MYDKALDNLNRHTYSCTDMQDITRTLEQNGDGFVKAPWCGSEECEDKVKEQTGVGSRCISLTDSPSETDRCVCCGKHAEHIVYWGKAY